MNIINFLFGRTEKTMHIVNDDIDNCIYKAKWYQPYTEFIRNRMINESNSLIYEVKLKYNRRNKIEIIKEITLRLNSIDRNYEEHGISNRQYQAEFDLFIKSTILMYKKYESK
jgi:hypothetical protein